jgi:CRP/FNR family transcriptional regulator
LGIAGPGAVLGLGAAISGRLHQVSIETLEPCQLRIIKADRFLDFLKKDSVACFATLTSLTNEVRKMYRCVRLLGLSQSATQRLAQVLIRWDMHEEDEPKNKPCLRFPLTHKELAEMVGVSRETVTRLLSTFQKRDIIHCQGTTLVIEDERTLRALAAPAA